MKSGNRVFWPSVFLSVLCLFFSAPVALHAAAGDVITETFDLSATQGDIASVYPEWRFIPAGGFDNATASVTGGQLRLGGDSSDPTSFRFMTAPTGAFTLDADLGAFPGDVCRNVGIQVGENEIVFHPGYPGTALRVEGTGGFGNTDIGYTLAAETLHHVRLFGDGLGNFAVTLTDGLNPSNAFSGSFSNPASVGGFLSITRASCTGYYGEAVADNFSLNVVSSNLPPDVSHATPSIAMLWPPNHQFAPVSILGVTDPEGAPVAITITGILQDEPTNSLGDGDTAPDATGLGTETAQLRAERSGEGNGRVYLINFEARDDQGGLSSGFVTVGAPRNRVNGNIPLNDGFLFDSTE